MNRLKNLLFFWKPMDVFIDGRYDLTLWRGDSLDVSYNQPVLIKFNWLDRLTFRIHGCKLVERLGC